MGIINLEDFKAQYMNDSTEIVVNTTVQLPEFDFMDNNQSIHGIGNRLNYFRDTHRLHNNIVRIRSGNNIR